MLLVHNEDQSSSAINEVFSNIIREKTIETLPYTLKRPSKLKFIYGNTIQDGTPTPDNPVEVQGCGERTKNLLDDLKTTTTTNGVTFTVDNASGTVTANGKATQNAFIIIRIPSNVTGNFYYSGCPKGGASQKYDIYPWDSTLNTRPTDWNGNPTSAVNNDYGEGMSKIKVIDGHSTLIACRIYSGYNAQNIVFRPMLRIPSESNVFEPYGYKIPVTISNGANSVTTPVYIGNEPLHKIDDYADYIDFNRGVVVRRIKKLVLTGNEDWYGSAKYRIGLLGQIGTVRPFCTHYIGTTYTGYMYIQNGQISVNGETARTLFIYDATNQTSSEDWKSYLAAQYAAGTPVTVWYALETPEEEPITISDITLHRNYNISTDTNIPPSAINIEMPQEIKEIRDNNGNLVYKNWNTILGSPALTFKSYGYKLKDYRIYGNTIQDGTPTPDNPVEVQGCGVRTRNIMPAGEKKTVKVNGVTFSSDGNGRYRISGTASEYSEVWFDLVSGFTAPTSVANGGQGTISFFNSQPIDDVRLFFYNGSTMVDSWMMYPSNRVNTIYNLMGNKYVDRIKLTINSGLTANMTITPEFTDDGILPSWYEPYGYKIPVTISNGVFLDEPLRGIGEYKDTLDLSTGVVTRKIKKLVLTGEEDWQLWMKMYYYKWGKTTPTDYGLICTHFPVSKGDENFDHIRLGGNYRDSFVIFISETIASTVADLKSYLAAQYAAGTPVTIWYVLATPETETVSVPSGLSGIIEGYCIQDGTPTPENPIEVVSNGTVQSDGTYLVPRTAQSITTPIYIGNEPLHKIGDYADYIDFERSIIVRRIKKLVLKGDDTETYTSAYDNYNRFFNYVLNSNGQNTLISTHFTVANISSTSTDVGLRIVSGKELRIRPENVNSMTVNALKTYLQQQYTNGTPVTVWYVLAEPEEEPITLPIIQTMNGCNIFNTDTTVPASTMYIKGSHIKNLKQTILMTSDDEIRVDKDGYTITASS